MKRLLLPVLIIMMACTTPAISKAKPRVNTVGKALQATVALQGFFGRTFCSGVIVDHKVLTAFHCIEDGTPVFVKTHEDRWEAAVWKTDKLDDLAVLVPADGHALGSGIRLARKAPTWGDDVWAIGHALGKYEYSVTKGIVSYPKREDGVFGGVWFQHDAGTVGGNSGGPVVNKHGRLVGITSFGVIQGIYCALGCPGAYQDTHINGAVHLSPIRALLR